MLRKKILIINVENPPARTHKHTIVQSSVIFHLVIVDKGRPICWNVRCIIFRQWFLSIPSSFVRYPVNSVWFSHACKRATNPVWQILLLSEGSCMHSHSRGKAPDTICSFLPRYLSFYSFHSDPSSQSAETVSNRAFHFFLSLARSVFPLPTSTFYTILKEDKKGKIQRTNFDFGLTKLYLKVLKIL